MNIITGIIAVWADFKVLWTKKFSTLSAPSNDNVLISLGACFWKNPRLSFEIWFTAFSLILRIVLKTAIWDKMPAKDVSIACKTAFIIPMPAHIKVSVYEISF